MTDDRDPSATPLDNDQIAAAGLADWRKLAQALHARFLVGDYPAAARFASEIADEAHRRGSQPDVRLTPGAIDVAVVTRGNGLWVTAPDLELAAWISAAAAERGLVAEPTSVTQLELALDTADEARVAPFWSALLTGDADNRVYDSVFDPTGRVPALWFQSSPSESPDRQRWHFDVWVAPEAADERIAAAVAAGGTVTDDSSAPSFTVLADRDGNRVCICSQASRA